MEPLWLNWKALRKGGGISVALEKLEEIAQETLDFLGKYNLTHDELKYVVGCIDRSLHIELMEDILEEYGLISFEEDEEETEA